MDLLDLHSIFWQEYVIDGVVYFNILSGLLSVMLAVIDDVIL